MATDVIYSEMEDQNEPFELGWFSTKGLHHRFGLQNTTPEKRVRKFMEEVAELVAASTLYEAGVGDRSHLLKEAADVYITMCGTLQAHGIIFSELENAVVSASLENDAKNDTTHHVVNDKITRRK